MAHSHVLLGATTTPTRITIRRIGLADLKEALGKGVDDFNAMPTHAMFSALIKQAKKLPSELNKSLTWDRGKELTDHRRFTLATNIDVYSCDPQSPWQRGSNENTKMVY